MIYGIAHNNCYWKYQNATQIEKYNEYKKLEWILSKENFFRIFSNPTPKRLHTKNQVSNFYFIDYGMDIYDTSFNYHCLIYKFFNRSQSWLFLMVDLNIYYLTHPQFLQDIKHDIHTGNGNAILIPFKIIVTHLGNEIRNRSCIMSLAKHGVSFLLVLMWTTSHESYDASHS